MIFIPNTKRNKLQIIYLTQPVQEKSLSFPFPESSLCDAVQNWFRGISALSVNLPQAVLPYHVEISFLQLKDMRGRRWKAFHSRYDRL